MRIILIIINLGKINYCMKRDDYELKGKVFISNEDG